jgi:hypothetical protein
MRPAPSLSYLIWLSLLSCSQAARSSYESLYSGSGYMIQTDSGSPPYSVTGRFVVSMRRSYFNVAGSLSSLRPLLCHVLLTPCSSRLCGLHWQRYIPGYVRIIVRDGRGRCHKVVSLSPLDVVFIPLAVAFNPITASYPILETLSLLFLTLVMVFERK